MEKINVDMNKKTRNINDYYHINDGISRAYSAHGTKRFMQWFNPKMEVPEVALCDEEFINDEPDYENKRDIINKLNVGESCIVEEDICIITRVK